MNSRSALVTGGASGIGRATAVRLAQRGLDVLIVDVDEEGLAEACKEISAHGGRAEHIVCDVSNDADVRHLRDAALDRLGRVDVLMCNAGVNATPADTIGGWKWLLDINLFGVVRCVNEFLPHMVERQSGYIINTSSAYGLLGGASAYSCAKWAVLGYSEGIALEQRTKGIGVSVLCPGFVQTRLISTTAKMLGREQPPELSAKVLARIEGMISPAEAARQLLEGLDAGRFVITTTIPPRIAREVASRANTLDDTHWTMPPAFKGDRGAYWRRAIGEDSDTSAD